LQAGELVSFVWPHYPRPGDRYGSAETVKVRTTIGELGQVLEVKHVSGSISLLPAAMSAIRLWRYKPTLLNRRPVQAQEDVTIEFRPPEHLPRVPTRHPSHN
jgi:outer membrane biosynthesis protein TonB